MVERLRAADKLGGAGAWCLQRWVWSRLQAREGTVWSKANKGDLRINYDELEQLFQVGGRAGGAVGSSLSEEAGRCGREKRFSALTFFCRRALFGSLLSGRLLLRVLAWGKGE